jgi:hypothetical protein
MWLPWLLCDAWDAMTDLNHASQSYPKDKSALEAYIAIDSHQMNSNR